MRYWVNTVSRDHVRLGVSGGFTQADHGRMTTLRRLSEGDLLALYSPRESYPDGVPLQTFTALGRIVDAQPYQAEMTPTFHPWRRRVAFLEGHDANIRPLLNELDFIKDKRRWGFVFRRGLFEIGHNDFLRIARAMGVDLNRTG
jgi:hypothetical protein